MWAVSGLTSTWPRSTSVCAELVTVNVTVNFGVLGANRTSQVPFRRPDASDQDHKPFPQSAIKRDSRSHGAKNGPGFVDSDLLPAA